MKKIFLLLTCIAFCSFVASSKTITIEKTNSTPIIDGNLENAVWDNIPAQSIDQLRGETDGFSSQFKMCYDTNNLYIAVMVTDPTPNIEGATTWQSDCVELFIAMDTADSPSYRPGDWQIRKVAFKTQDDGGVDGSSNVANAEGIKVVQVDGNSYTQEWVLPWNTLVEDADFDGQNFRFDVHVAQANITAVGRVGQAFWNSNADDQWNSIKNQGLIVLKENVNVILPPPPPPPPVPDPTPFQGKKLTISKTSLTPVIDGTLEDDVWKNIPAQNIDQLKGETDGFSSQFKMCYDTNNLYIAVMVTDPTPNIEGATTWQSDCVELFIAMDTTNAPTYRPGDWQFRKVAFKTQMDGGVDGSINVATAEGIRVEQVDGNIYIQEWVLPWNTLIEDADFDGQNFRFDVQVAQANNSDIGRVGQAFWNSNADNQWAAIKDHGLIVLNENIFNIPPPPVPNPFQGKTLNIWNWRGTPIIDGSLDDAVWKSIPAQNIDQLKGETEGFSAQFKMCYDYTNLYVGVTVTDPDPDIIGPSTWSSDCVELFFAMDTANADSYRPGDWQFRKISAKAQSEGGVDGSSNVATAEGIIVEQGGFETYEQEWSLSWKTLIETSNFDGEQFRFDIQVAQAKDAVAGRVGQVFWNSNADDQWSKIKNQGLITLGIKTNISNLIEPQVEINVYPQPAIELLNIKSTIGIVRYEIYNVNSAIVGQSFVNSPEFKINLSAYTSGVYVVRMLTVKGDVLSKKVVKQ